jgi:NAD(P)-dependent dehydrogenase (short-subunit alcohol dehydrogenase family)
VKTLEGKVAIITGGASGIGRALGAELAARGCEVVLADRQYAVAQGIADELTAQGKKASAVSLDVRDLGAFERVANDVVARTGKIDFLFNNAGIAVGGEVDGYAQRDWDDVFDVNLRGVTHGIQAVYPHMVRLRTGHIINTASVAGLVATGGTASYTATKHAVVGLSKSMRQEGVRHGVKVSVLCPGAIRTPILSGGKYSRTGFANVSSDQLLGLWEKARPMDPAVFAKKVIDQVERNVAIIVVPRWWKAFWYLDRISPALSMAVGRRMLEQLRKDLDRLGATREERPQPAGKRIDLS